MKRLMLLTTLGILLSTAGLAHAAQPLLPGQLEYDEIQGWVTVDLQTAGERVSVPGQDDPEMND